MKQSNFTKNTEAELAKSLGEKREEVRVFRFSMTGSTARDVTALHRNKKDIARILSEVNRRAQTA